MDNSIIISEHEIMEALQHVMDPEIPTLSVVDMGMITVVEVKGESAEVKMIPTFTACPALKLIKQNIYDAVKQLGFNQVNVIVDDTIIWNSDRITEQGKKLLTEFGLGTPQRHEGKFSMEEIAASKCPHCGSDDTTLKSIFGSTLCRSIHFCFNCKQGFERFKPL